MAKIAPFATMGGWAALLWASLDPDTICIIEEVWEQFVF